jgi:hypothetical protein
MNVSPTRAVSLKPDHTSERTACLAGCPLSSHYHYNSLPIRTITDGLALKVVEERPALLTMNSCHTPLNGLMAWH